MNEVLADRYELEAMLGSGGMARVWQATDRLLHRRVAVKLLRDDVDLGSGEGSVLSEARSAAALSHRNAVAVYDVGRAGDRPFIVMELVEGCSLAELLDRRGRLTPEQAVAVAGQTLDALAAAHDRELIHRDVKPANILLPGCRVPEGLGQGADVKLADFGIAKAMYAQASARTMAGEVIGTPTYLSPEQVAGRGATAASDVYAVGVVLYEMLAGRPPFTADSPVATALAHQRETPQPLDQVAPEVPQALADVVARALSKDPEERWASAAQMRAALMRWRDDEPLEPTLVDRPIAAAPVGARDDAQQPVVTGSGSRMSGWRPAVTVAITALVLLLAVLLATAIADRPTSEPTTPTEQQTEEPTAEPTEEPTQEPTQEPTAEPTTEPSPQDGVGLGLPELPDPSDVTVGGVADTVRRIPEVIVGSRRDDLADGLDEVADAPADGRPEQASQLADDVTQWVDDGELNARVADFVGAVLRRVASSGG